MGQIKKNSYLFDPKQGGALNDVGSYCRWFCPCFSGCTSWSVESHIEKENEIEMNFKATLNFENDIQGKVEGSINYNKERYALIKGEREKSMFQCLTVWLNIQFIRNEVCKNISNWRRRYDFRNTSLINHNQSTHTLQDSKRIQETIERIREEAK